MPASRSSPVFNTLFILALGGVGGLAFYFLGLPAPFMLGSMITCWMAGVFLPPIRPWLSFPWTLRFMVVSAVAVVLGSYATPAAIGGILGWWPSMLLLAVLSLAMAWLSYFYLRRRGYDDAVAWFSAQPAGLSEAVTMAARYTDKDYLVALFHLVRVSSVFMCAPIIVWFASSNFDTQAVPSGQQHFWQVAWWTWPLYAVIAIVGNLGGKLIRLPMSMLLGPMLLSATLSGMGVLELERPFEAICLIQVALGASIGGRMGQVNFRKLWRVVPDAYINAIGVIAIALAGAFGLSMLTGDPVIKIFLAISPGGVSELSLIAVALGYEVAFVTLHHLFRMAVVMFAMPFKKMKAIASQ